MSPKEEDDDWTTVNHGDGDNEAVSPAPPDAAIAAAADADDNTSKDASTDQNTSVVQEGVEDLKVDEAKETTDAPSSAAASLVSAAPEAKFYEGDKVMYVADGKDADSGAVKVRIVSVNPPNYEIALPSSNNNGDAGGEIIKIPINHPGLLSLDDYESRELQKEVGMLDIVSSELFGGDGGGPFDDLVTTKSTGNSKTTRRMTEICIQSGSIVDGIGATYSDGTKTYYGGDGGGLHRLVLKSGEYITEAIVRYGKFVHELTFKTNTGRKLGPCGGKGGLLLGLTASEVCVRAPDRFYALAAIYGRFGKFVDAIGFHWAPIAAETEDVQTKDIVTNLSKQLVLKTTELYGGDGGSDFNDGHYNIRVTDITVITKRDGPVRGLSVRYFTGKVAAHGGKAKTGKTDEESLALDKEHVNEVHVRHNDMCVISLTFITNKGARLGPCGMIPDKDKDDCWDGCRDSVVKAPTGYMLIGIKGRSSDKMMDSIGFNWSPAPKGH